MRLFFIACSLYATSVYGQLDSSFIEIDAVMVNAVRATDKSPTVYTNVSAEKLKSQGTTNSIPMSLNMETSIVAISESGLPTGNTSLRIRGTDATRTNITLNGLPLNDGESHEVFWVNLPNLLNNISSLQIQRGVGSTSHGSGAFGAALHLQTDMMKPFPKKSNTVTSESSLAYGSYGMYNANLGLEIQRIANTQSGLQIQYNRVTTDGYIRNGWTKHQSLYGSGYFQHKNTVIKLNFLWGNQHTGITWEGVSPEDMILYGRTYNPAGRYTDEAGNTLFYGNESDNYQQKIVQLAIHQKISANLKLSAAVGYTGGKGYYENFKEDAKFSKYGLSSQTIDTITYSRSDIIVSRQMNNDQIAGTAWLTYNLNALQVQVGGMGSFYLGNHYGLLPWVKYNESIAPNSEYYRNKGKKTDGNIFIKANYTFPFPLSIFVDIQQRWIDYRLSGTDNDLVLLNDRFYYPFFNPKVGISYRPTSSQQLFLSVGMAHREPARTDLKEAIKNGTPDAIKPERLLDYELGYQYFHAPSKLNIQANFYFMQYYNQLIPTGKLSDVGYRLMENVKQSYRTGIELMVNYPILKWLEVYATATFSSNKILNYTAYFDTYNNSTDFEYVGQTTQFLKSTNLSYSPSVICSGNLRFIPVKNGTIDFSVKHVGKQFYDNTSTSELSLPAYTIANLRVAYKIFLPYNKTMICEALIYNLFNLKYEANAWGDRSVFADNSQTIYYRGLYPQAPVNFSAKLTLQF